MTIFAKKSKKSKIFKVKKKIFSEKKKKNFFFSFSLKHKLCFECHTRLSTRGMVGVIWILKKNHFLQKNAISRVDKMAVFEIFAFGKASFDGGERRGGPWSKKSNFFFFPFLV